MPDISAAEEAFAPGEIRMDATVPMIGTGTLTTPFTTTEFRILRTLALQPAAVIRRAALLDAISKEQTQASSRCLDVHISRLRSKLRGSGYAILTVKGVGYRIIQTIHRTGRDLAAPAVRMDES